METQRTEAQNGVLSEQDEERREVEGIIYPFTKRSPGSASGDAGGEGGLHERDASALLRECSGKRDKAHRNERRPVVQDG